MSQRKKDNKPTPPTGNWVHEQTNLDYHKQAIKKAEKHQIWESEHHFQTVRIDRRTIILKRLD